MGVDASASALDEQREQSPTSTKSSTGTVKSQPAQENQPLALDLQLPLIQAEIQMRRTHPIGVGVPILHDVVKPERRHSDPRPVQPPLDFRFLDGNSPVMRPQLPGTNPFKS